GSQRDQQPVGVRDAQERAEIQLGPTLAEVEAAAFEGVALPSDHDVDHAKAERAGAAEQLAPGLGRQGGKVETRGDERMHATVDLDASATHARRSGLRWVLGLGRQTLHKGGSLSTTRWLARRAFAVESTAPEPEGPQESVRFSSDLDQTSKVWEPQ